MGIDNEVVRLAEQRNQLLRVDDLLELGLSRKQVRTRTKRERFFTVYDGVVSLRPPPFDFTARAIAACLARPEGVLSFATAAYLHGIRRAPRECLDMTVTRSSASRLPDVHFHYTNRLPESDVHHQIDGMRLTTPARSLFDLASVLDGPALRSAVEDARRRRLVTDLELDEVASRLVGRGRPGSVMFRHVVDPLLGEAPVRSHYELVVREAFTAAGLVALPDHPLRLRNGRRVFLDLALVDSRIDVEIDPASTHTTPAAVAADKARDVQVSLVGWQPIRFTEDDVDRRLRSIVGYVRALDRQRRAA